MDAKEFQYNPASYLIDSLTSVIRKIDTDFRWNDKKSFLLSAKDLTIADPKHWRLSPFEDLKQSCYILDVKGAELRGGCAIKVHGKFDSSQLTTGGDYELFFIVEKKDWAEVWAKPISVKLSINDELMCLNPVMVKDMPINQLVGIRIGEITAPPDGELVFELEDKFKIPERKGLVVWGVFIWQKN